MNSFDLRGKLLVTCVSILGLMPLSAVAADQQLSTAVAAPAPVSRGTLGRWEFRAAPLQALFRFYSGEFAYRFSKQFSLGPSVVVYDSAGNIGGMFGPTYHGSSFGLNATYYFKSVATSTPYISGHAFYGSYTAYGHDFYGYSEHAGVGSDAVIGYQWRWSPVSLRLGGGVEYANEDVRTVTSGKLAGDPGTVELSMPSGFFPTIEFKLGIEI